MEMSVALQRMKAHPHKLDVIYGIKSPWNVQFALQNGLLTKMVTVFLY